MDMSYVMLQLVHLTCRKYHIQYPRRKGSDLFWRTSDDNSRFTPINIHEDELEAPRVRETMIEEKSSEEYKRAVDTPQ